MPWGKWVWCPRKHRKMSRCEEWTICPPRVTSCHQVIRHFEILPLQETIWRNWPFFLLTRWLSSSTWDVIFSTHLNPFYLFNPSKFTTSSRSSCNDRWWSQRVDQRRRDRRARSQSLPRSWKTQENVERCWMFLGKSKHQETSRHTKTNS